PTEDSNTDSTTSNSAINMNGSGGKSTFNHRPGSNNIKDLNGTVLSQSQLSKEQQKTSTSLLTASTTISMPIPTSALSGIPLKQPTQSIVLTADLPYPPSRSVSYSTTSSTTTTTIMDLTSQYKTKNMLSSSMRDRISGITSFSVLSSEKEPTELSRSSSSSKDVTSKSLEHKRHSSPPPSTFQPNNKSTISLSPRQSTTALQHDRNGIMADSSVQSATKGSNNNSHKKEVHLFDDFDNDKSRSTSTRVGQRRRTSFGDATIKLPSSSEQLDRVQAYLHPQINTNSNNTEPTTTTTSTSSTTTSSPRVSLQIGGISTKALKDVVKATEGMWADSVSEMGRRVALELEMGVAAEVTTDASVDEDEKSGKGSGGKVVVGGGNTAAGSSSASNSNMSGILVRDFGMEGKGKEKQMELEKENGGLSSLSLPSSRKRKFDSSWEVDKEGISLTTGGMPRIMNVFSKSGDGLLFGGLDVKDDMSGVDTVSSPPSSEADNDYDIGKSLSGSGGSSSRWTSSVGVGASGDGKRRKTANSDYDDSIGVETKPIKRPGRMASSSSEDEPLLNLTSKRQNLTETTSSSTTTNSPGASKPAPISISTSKRPPNSASAGNSGGRSPSSSSDDEPLATKRTMMAARGNVAVGGGAVGGGGRKPPVAPNLVAPNQCGDQEEPENVEVVPAPATAPRGRGRPPSSSTKKKLEALAREKAEAEKAAAKKEMEEGETRDAVGDGDNVGDGDGIKNDGDGDGNGEGEGVSNSNGTAAGRKKRRRGAALLLDARDDDDGPIISAEPYIYPLLMYERERPQRGAAKGKDYNERRKYTVQQAEEDARRRKRPRRGVLENSGTVGVSPGGSFNNSAVVESETPVEDKMEGVDDSGKEAKEDEKEKDIVEEVMNDGGDKEKKDDVDEGKDRTEQEGPAQIELGKKDELIDEEEKANEMVVVAEKVTIETVNDKEMETEVERDEDRDLENDKETDAAVEESVADDAPVSPPDDENRENGESASNAGKKTRMSRRGSRKNITSTSRSASVADLTTAKDDNVTVYSEE
ncbi:hypothetical protein HDU76_007833, partial [Blyttiomyces sp. JEL0837]